MQFWFGYSSRPAASSSSSSARSSRGSSRRPLAAAVRHRPSLVLVAAGYAATFWVPFQYTFVTATLVPIGMLIAAVADSDARSRSTWLSKRPMVWLGEVSFGFYLVQGVTIFYLRTLLGDEPFGTPVALLVIALFFTVSLLAGWLLYRYVEMPAMRRFSRSRKPAATAPAVSLPAQRGTTNPGPATNPAPAPAPTPTPAPAPVLDAVPPRPPPRPPRRNSPERRHPRAHHHRPRRNRRRPPHHRIRTRTAARPRLHQRLRRQLRAPRPHPSADRTLILPDYAGSGRTPLPPGGELAVEDLAAQMAAVLEARAEGPVDVAGASSAPSSPPRSPPTTPTW